MSGQPRGSGCGCWSPTGRRTNGAIRPTNRHVRVNVTSADRKLQQQVEGSAPELIEATGLGDDFAKVQQTISRLRDNLLSSTKS